MDEFSVYADESLTVLEIIDKLDVQFQNYRNNKDEVIEQLKTLLNNSVITSDQLKVLEEYFSTKALELNDLELSYLPELNLVKSQLAESESKTKLTDWELQNKKRKQKPFFTVVDDDGHNAVLTQLLPLANQYGFKFTTTVIGNSIIPGGNASFMKIPDLISLQNQGHEISSHTYTHDPVSTPAKVDALTEADFENEFSQMDVIAKANGLKFNTLVYPGGARNDLEISVARKYYRAARTTEYGINTMPIETWDLKVLNGYTSEYDAYTTNAQRLAYLKIKVDEMIANNGWGIFVTHLYLDITQVELLEGLVQYVQSKGIEIVTLNEGLNRYGNVVDIGRYVKQDLTKKHLAVAPDGSFSGSELQSVAKSVTGAPITFTTPPKDIPQRSILISSLLFSQSAGMPEAQGGVLITTQYRNYLADDIGSGLVRQQYRVNSTNHVYERYSIDDNTWSAFERINIIKVIPTNTVTVTTPYSSFPKNCMSKCKITTTTGFPENSAGILTTDWIDDNTAYTTQTYDIADSGTSYKRFYDYTVSGWSAFRRTTIVAKTTAQRNGASFPKNIGDMVFDTTLGKAIWYNGTAWIDSVGTTV